MGSVNICLVLFIAYPESPKTPEESSNYRLHPAKITSYDKLCLHQMITRRDDPESEVIVPRYGVTRCTMDRSADLPYLFGPISVLLGCNLILFPTTLYHIYKSQKITKLSGMKSSMLQHKLVE